MDKKHCSQITFAIIFGILALGAVFITTRAELAMTCVFCDIVNKKTSSEILYEDDNFIVFRDIKPASKFHFLIIPKKHVANTKSLTAADKPMREYF